MVELNFDIANTKPAGDGGLGVGQYVVRIETEEVKAVKDKFNTDGSPSEYNGKEHRLVFGLKVYGGPDNGAGEYEGLNLWNHNPDAVSMAQRTLKSMQIATGVPDPLPGQKLQSTAFLGKWMMLEIEAGKKDPTKLYKKFTAAPPALIPADVPAVAGAPVAAQAAAPQTPFTPAQPAQAAAPAGPVAPNPVAGVPQPGYTPGAQPQVAEANRVPSWAHK